MLNSCALFAFLVYFLSLKPMFYNLTNIPFFMIIELCSLFFFTVFLSIVNFLGYVIFEFSEGKGIRICVRR